MYTWADISRGAKLEIIYLQKRTAVNVSLLFIHKEKLTLKKKLPPRKYFSTHITKLQQNFLFESDSVDNFPFMNLYFIVGSKFKGML